MKKSILSLLIICILSLSISGCFGSFSLTHQVYNFNRNIEDKFVRTIVLWAFIIVPVYNVVMFVDFAVLNLIEFWTDKNPLAMNKNEEHIRYYSVDDKNYEVVISKNRYDIKNIDEPEKQLSLVFDENSKSWFSIIDGIANQLTENDTHNAYFYDSNGNLILSKSKF